MINKKIINLTKIFLKDYSERLEILNNKNKTNKNISITWLLWVLAFCLTYLSVNIISYLKKIKIPELFLKVYLPIMAIVMLFQLLLIICNLFFYSKDLEYVLPMPVKPIEILIAKIFTTIGIMYITEAMLLIIPLFIYWILVDGTIKFLFYGIFTLLVFPIFYTLVIAIITLIIENIFKNIKNKNIIHILIVAILTIFLGIFLYLIIQQSIINGRIQIDLINRYFVIINPILGLLMEDNILNNISDIIKIISINILFFTIFYLLGKKIYKANSLINYAKNNLENNKTYKYEKIKKEKAYLKNEIKKISRNTTYFLQQVFNYIALVIITLFLINATIPFFVQQLQENNLISDISFEELKLQLICIALIIIQVISTFNNLSITAISRDGRESVFMKYIPIPLYKQFVIKTIPQIILNIIMTIAVFLVISINIKTIPILYYVIVFILAIMIHIIYSYMMVLVDCKNPNLNWTNEESITKGNNNKIYQYIISIAIILILVYFSKIFENTIFEISIIIMIVAFTLIFFILNKYIKKNINKIFKKIY